MPGVSDASRLADQVGSTAQLFFYDWEANILDEECKTDSRHEREPAHGDQRSPRGGHAGLEVQGRRRW